MTYWKDLFFGPENKWADLAAHIAGLFSVGFTVAILYQVFGLQQPPSWGEVAALVASISTLLGVRVAKDHFRKDT